MPCLQLQLLSRLHHLSCSSLPIFLHLLKSFLAQSPLQMEGGREEVLLVQEDEVFVNRLQEQRRLAQGTKRLEALDQINALLQPT